MATKEIHQYNAAIGIDGAADYLLIDPGSTGTYNSINRNVLLGITSTPIGASDAQSLSNKTLDNTNAITVKDGSFTVQNTSDTTKRAVFSASGITTGTTRTLTLPNRTDTLVTLAGTETLTNKTITSPTITGGTIDNSAITVDSISGHTSASQVTVGGVLMNNGVIGTSGAVVAASILAGAIQPQGLVSGTGTSWAWTSWTPSVVNLTVGAGGTLAASYTQIGKTVFFKIRFVLGSGSAVSTGPTFSLPVTASSFYSPADAIVGWGIAVAGSTEVEMAAQIVSTTTVRPTLIGTATTYLGPSANITSTVPGIWASSNYMTLTGFYEAA